jgi:hypothetical protein
VPEFPVASNAQKKTEGRRTPPTFGPLKASYGYPLEDISALVVEGDVEAFLFLLFVDA